MKIFYNKTFLSENPSFDSIFVSRLRIDDYKFDLNERIISIQEILYCDIDPDTEYTRCSINKNESTVFWGKDKLCINPNILDNGREIALH